MDYAEYLTTDHWKRIAQETRERDGACRVCASTEKLEVHHRTYVRLGRERPDDLVTLCWRCHRRFHGTYDECVDRQLQLPIVPRGAELN